MSYAHLTGTCARLVALALLAATPSAFAVKIAYTVGSNAPGLGHCDAADIPTAVAMAKANPPHTIYVARNATYSAQAITIDNQDVLIVGGFNNCGDFLAPSFYTPLSGAGNGGQSLISITGTSHVSLSHLTLSTTGESGPSPSKGGGISFIGAGSLDLNDMTVSTNQAGSGGGIYMDGSSGAGTLTFGNNVLVQNNVAGFGAGVYLQGAAHLLMSGTGTQVSSNVAPPAGGPGLGGGIYLLGPAQADIGAPGIGGHGAIYNNVAESDGGGIYVQGSAAGKAILTLFTTDPAHPVFLDSNMAARGGALWIEGLLGPAVACLFDMRIGSNSALRDAVAHSDAANLYINANPAGACSSTALATAVRCTPGPGCNEISANTDGSPGFGLIDMVGGVLDADRIIFDFNTSDYAVSSTGGQRHISNCLISGNHFLEALIYSASGDFSLDGCTTANNAVDSHVLFASVGLDPDNNPSRFILSNSVIYEFAAFSTFNANAVGSGILEADYDLLSDTSTVSTGSHYFSADPQFVDPANGDYRLQSTSPAIDFSPTSGGFDLDGNPRNVVVYEDITPRDIGAYEYQLGVPDRIFADGFDRL